MPKQFELPLEERLLLRSRDVAGLLCISERAVWRLAAEGSLPRPVQVGKNLRWRRADIDAAVAGLPCGEKFKDLPQDKAPEAKPAGTAPKRSRRSPRAAMNAAMEALKRQEWDSQAAAS